MRKPITTLFCLVLALISYAQKAPDFAVTDVHGVTHQLYKDYLNKDKAVLLKLFFVDCPPCNRAAPKVQALYVNEWQEGQGRVEFMELSVKAWDTDENVTGYVNKHGITFPSVSPQGGSLVAVSPYTRGDYGRFLGTPTYVIIGPKGDVHFNVLFNQLSDTLRSVLVKDPPVDQCPSAFSVEVQPKGKFFYGVSLDNISVQLKSSDTDLDDYDIPFKDSLYGYECEYQLPIDSSNYMLGASYPAQALQGVNTKDLLFVLWHLIGKRVFEDQDLLYAADVNENGLINIQDILYIRQLILQKRMNFPKDPAVRFWDASNEVVLDTLLDTLPITRNSIPLTQTIGRSDIVFKGVKLGDITGILEAYTENTTREIPEEHIRIGDIFMQSGKTYRIPIGIKHPSSLYALQWGFRIRPGSGELLSVAPSNLWGRDVVLEQHTKGAERLLLYALSPDAPIRIDDRSTLLFLNIKAKEDIWLSDVLSLDDDMEAMLMNDAMDEVGLRLEFDGKRETSNAAFTISYHAPLARLIVQNAVPGIQSIALYDLTGRRWMQQKLGGDTHCALSTPALPKGIYLIEITTTEGKSQTHRVRVN